MLCTDGRPAAYGISGDRIPLRELLGMEGDLMFYGGRGLIDVIRKTDGKRQILYHD